MRAREAHAMAEYPDGTRDCPNCLAAGKTVGTFPQPARIRGDMRMCGNCAAMIDGQVRRHAPEMIAEADLYLRRLGEFSDWLIEHGQAGDVAA